MAKVAVGTMFPKAGDWCWAPSEEAPERIVLGLPDVGTVRLKVIRGGDPGECPNGPLWGWNGDLESPTLEPSIDTTDERHNWHGHLRRGELTGSLTEIVR